MMAKLEQALRHLRAVGALVTVTGYMDSVEQVRQLAAMSGATVQHQMTVGGRVLEWFRVVVDGATVDVSASRPATPADFDALEPAVRA